MFKNHSDGTYLISLIASIFFPTLPCKRVAASKTTNCLSGYYN